MGLRNSVTRTNDYTSWQVQETVSNKKPNISPIISFPSMISINSRKTTGYEECKVYCFIRTNNGDHGFCSQAGLIKPEAPLTDLTFVQNIILNLTINTK